MILPSVLKNRTHGPCFFHGEEEKRIFDYHKILYPTAQVELKALLICQKSWYTVVLNVHKLDLFVNLH